MGYRLNRLDEPVFMAVSKPLLTEFGIHHRLESCGLYTTKSSSAPNFENFIMDFFITIHFTDGNVHIIFRLFLKIVYIFTGLLFMAYLLSSPN